MDNFFYNLNDKLNAIREKPEVTHKQLNERDMSRAAKGYEKYGKQGMEALAKAGRDGKALDPVRKKYDKYDNTEVDEGVMDTVKSVGKKVASGINKLVGHGSDEDMRKDVQRKAGAPVTGKKPEQKTTEAAKYRDPKYKDKLYTQEPPDYTYGPDMDDAYYNPKPDDYAGRKRKIGGGEFPSTDPLERGQGIGRSGIKNNILDRGPRKGLPSRDQISSLKSSIKAAHGTHAEPNLPEAGNPMTAKQKSFAALAPPKDKITFADKIAGAKKEVDEMLGDVAAEAMKKALGGGRSRGQGMEEASQDNAFTAHKRARAETPKVGTITHGSKHDVEEIPGGRRVTRRTDAQGISVGADDDKPADGEKRGRGRPKGPAKAPERVTGGATKHKGGRKTNEGEINTGNLQQMWKLVTGLKTFVQDPDGQALLKELTGMVKHYMNQGGEQELDEKAVSKKQQKFMGMVHAAQKGEKPASGAVAKTAKTMGKKDAEDFASTKHKGLPEKKKSDSKKETNEEAADNKPGKSSGGVKFGGGIYDSLNRDLELMIAESMSCLDESMSINMSMNNDEHGGPTKSLTVTATDEDAIKLSQLLKSAGLGGGDEGYGGSGYQSACGCGTPDCSCGDQEMDEAYGDTQPTLNEPDYPTNTETAEDNFEYAGGLNKPKSTGQTTVPVIASQEERQESYAAEEEDAIKRMMEMAGIKEGKKPDFLDVDKDGDKAEPFKKAVKDKEEKKVDESILAATANLWSEYKGKYGV